VFFLLFSNFPWHNPLFLPKSCDKFLFHPSNILMTFFSLSSLQFFSFITAHFVHHCMLKHALVQAIIKLSRNYDVGNSSKEYSIPAMEQYVVRNQAKGNTIHRCRLWGRQPRLMIPNNWQTPMLSSVIITFSPNILVCSPIFLTSQRYL